MLTKLRNKVAQHERQLSSLRPIRSPGMLTSQTTRGVVRRVKVNPTTRAGAPASDNKPRWG